MCWGLNFLVARVEGYWIRPIPPPIIPPLFCFSNTWNSFFAVSFFLLNFLLEFSLQEADLTGSPHQGLSGSLSKGLARAEWWEPFPEYRVWVRTWDQNGEWDDGTQETHNKPQQPGCQAAGVEACLPSLAAVVVDLGSRARCATFSKSCNLLGLPWWLSW